MKSRSIRVGLMLCSRSEVFDLLAFFYKTIFGRILRKRQTLKSRVLKVRIWERKDEKDKIMLNRWWIGQDSKLLWPWETLESSFRSLLGGISGENKELKWLEKWKPDWNYSYSNSIEGRLDRLTDQCLKIRFGRPVLIYPISWRCDS